MRISKTRILVGAYILALVIFFLYYLFPSETAKDYLSYQLSQVNPAIKIEIEYVKPAFPPGLRLHNVNFYHLDTELARLEMMNIVPTLLSLFSSETHLSFKGRGYSGKLNGNAEIASNSPVGQVVVDTTISGMQLKEIPVIKQLSKYKIAGILDGIFMYKSSASNQTLSGNVSLSDCQMDLAASLFNLGSVTFREVEAELLLQNQTLTIKKCSLAGNQLDASISGSITKDNRSGNPALNLTGTIKPHHVFLAKLEKSLPFSLFKGNKAGEQGFSFQLKGTTDKPEFSLN